MERRRSVAPVERQKPRPATVLFAALVLGVLVLTNVIGRFQVRADPNVAHQNEDGPGLSVVRTTDAGWPLTYLIIPNHRSLPLVYLDEGIAERSFLAVAFNAAVIFVIVLVASWVFNQWTLRKRKLWQFGLLDVALLTTFAAIVLALILLPRWQHARDSAVVNMLEAIPDSRSDTPVRQAVWQPDRHEWLRWLVGEKRLPPGSHVVGLDIEGAYAAEAARLPRLRVVKLRGNVADRQLRLLETLPELVCLDLSDVQITRSGIAEGEATAATALPLPKLKRLIAPASNLCSRDLAACTGLEELDLARGKVDRELASAIGKLTSLCVLNLSHTGLDDNGIQHLAGLDHLTVLDLSGTQVTDAGLKEISRLPALRTLWLKDTLVTDKGLEVLGDCPELTTIWVVGSGVTPGGVARWRTARNERQKIQR